MKTNQKILFSFLITLLVVCAALYVGKLSRDRYSDQVMPVMAGTYEAHEKEEAGLTFTDLAHTVNSVLNGEVGC